MTNPRLDLNDARSRDAAHPLKQFRDRFQIVDPDTIYLDGNSLGRLPKATRTRLQDVIDHEWGERLIRSWGTDWFDAAERIGEKLAPLIGAASGQVIFSDSTSVNLYKLTMAALELQAPRKKVISDELNFPSDLYVIAGSAQEKGGRVQLAPPAADGLMPDTDAIIAAIDQDTALVTLSHVAFKSGCIYDAKRITEAAHAKGALVLWDLCHSAGAVPVELDAWQADLAVGCGYKYLNGGPGAPGFMYVRKELQEQLTSPIQGWFGRAGQFGFDLDYRPAQGMRRFTVGTPPVLSLSAVEPGIEMIAEAGIGAIREASEMLTSYLIELADLLLAPHRFELATPRDTDRRGSHVTLAHDDGYRISLAMQAAGVIPDFRAPNGIRLGIAPLYVSHEDIFVAVQRMVGIVESGAHLGYSQERRAVT